MNRKFRKIITFGLLFFCIILPSAKGVRAASVVVVDLDLVRGYEWESSSGLGGAHADYDTTSEQLYVFAGVVGAGGGQARAWLEADFVAPSFDVYAFNVDVYVQAVLTAWGSDYQEAELRIRFQILDINDNIIANEVIFYDCVNSYPAPFNIMYNRHDFASTFSQSIGLTLDIGTYHIRVEAYAGCGSLASFQTETDAHNTIGPSRYIDVTSLTVSYSPTC